VTIFIGDSRKDLGRIYLLRRKRSGEAHVNTVEGRGRPRSGRLALSRSCRLVLSQRRRPTARRSGRAARAEVAPLLRSGSSGLELPPAAPKRPASLLRSGSSGLELPPAAPKRPVSLLRSGSSGLELPPAAPKRPASLLRSAPTYKSQATPRVETHRLALFIAVRRAETCVEVRRSA